MKRRLPIFARNHFLGEVPRFADEYAGGLGMPSMIRLCGTIGKAGYKSCRYSSASETFLIAVADWREVNSVNLSIQIQRMVNK